MGVRLLFDEYLPSRLARELGGDFGESSDVVTELGPRPSDEAIWTFARDHDFVIGTKDDDFQRFSVARGFPPKVIWIRQGNASTEALSALLRVSVAQIAAFIAHHEAAFLPLGR